MQPNLSSFLPLPSRFEVQEGQQGPGGLWRWPGRLCHTWGVPASAASVPSSSEPCPERARRFCSFSWGLEKQSFAGYSSLLWQQTLWALNKGK